MSTKRAYEIIEQTVKAVGTDAEWTDYADAVTDRAMTYGDLTAVLSFLLDGGYVDEDALMGVIGHAIQAMAAE